jgi:hypothetical protein
MINEGFLREEEDYMVKWYQWATFGVGEGYKILNVDIKKNERDIVYVLIYKDIADRRC